MIFRELAILLPCHSLEDFPLYHTGEDADSLLSCWTALWHPALVATTGAGPKWHRVDLPPEDLQGKLILVPTVSVSQLPTGFGQRAKEAGAILIRQETDRQSILRKALGALDQPSTVDEELVADFLALGYGYLQVQILTRQMRYSSNLDETHFFNQLVAGAVAAVAGQIDEAHSKIAACFDLLAEERDHYYSVDAYLLDVTLVAETTIGKSLRDWLQTSTPINLLISGQVLDGMSQREPESIQAISQAISEQRLGVIGGEYSERLLPLLSCEGILSELRRGRAGFEKALNHRVAVFGRRRFGLTPILPGMLEKLRFAGALHFTLDDGHFPSAAQVKTRWEGLDSGAIDAIAKSPLDATKSETFLSYAQKLGESMDSDHVATLSFAHWPGQVSTWYYDLIRCARYTPTLGKFLTAEHYFNETYRPGSLDRFEVDKYKSPYLKQSVIRKHPDPISSVVRYWRRRVLGDACDSLRFLTAAISRGTQEGVSYADQVEQIEAALPADIDKQLVESFRASCRGFADSLPKDSSQNRSGCLVVNPFGFSRRIGVELESAISLESSKPLVALGTDESRTQFVVDVPPMGYVWLGAAESRADRKKSEPPLAEDGRAKSEAFWLRNEFFEIRIDPVTGAMKSLNDYHTRGNRLSQQLALRFPSPPGQPGDVWRDPDENAQYSVMAADDVQVTASNSALGEITTSGRLLDREGQMLAKFVQRYRVWRGSRILQLEIDLDTITEPTSDAWNSYYACRFAWNDESATLAVGANQTRQIVNKQRIEAPLYVDIDHGETRSTVLTAGLPFHRKVGDRMLDSLLVVRGEWERRFRLGIGVDLPQSLPEALGFVASPCQFAIPCASPKPDQSWLFHLDTRSVTPTHWSLLAEEGQIRGIRVRLLESAGKSGRLKLSAFRSFLTARQVNFLGETLSECAVTEGRIGIDIGPHEWIEVEGRWA